MVEIIKSDRSQYVLVKMNKPNKVQMIVYNIVEIIVHNLF